MLCTHIWEDLSDSRVLLWKARSIFLCQKGIPTWQLSQHSGSTVPPTTEPAMTMPLPRISTSERLHCDQLAAGDRVAILNRFEPIWEDPFLPCRAFFFFTFLWCVATFVTSTCTLIKIFKTLQVLHLDHFWLWGLAMPCNSGRRKTICGRIVLVLRPSVANPGGHGRILGPIAPCLSESKMVMPVLKAICLVICGCFFGIMHAQRVSGKFHELYWCGAKVNLTSW